jgi:hypothetical protein
LSFARSAAAAAGGSSAASLPTGWPAGERRRGRPQSFVGAFPFSAKFVCMGTPKDRLTHPQNRPLSSRRRRGNAPSPKKKCESGYPAPSHHARQTLIAQVRPDYPAASAPQLRQRPEPPGEPVRPPPRRRGRCSAAPDGVSGKSRRSTAYPQQIVTTRLLYCLQDRFAQLSRMQRI